MADNIRIDRELRNPKLKELLGVRMEIGMSGNKDTKKLNDALEKVVYEMVENASFLVPAEIDVEPVKEKDGGLSIPASTNLSFVIFSLENGQKFIPVFSDSEQLARWQDKADNVHTVTMNFPSLALLLEQSTEDEGLVLNPYSDNMMIKREMALRWYEQLQISKNGSANNIITLDKAKDVYTLNPYPFQLSNVLCDAARKIPEIKSIWLRGINLNGEDSYLLIVDFTGDRRKIFPPLGEAAKKFLDNKPLHIVPLDQGFGGKAVEGVTPVYTRAT